MAIPCIRKGLKRFFGKLSIHGRHGLAFPFLQRCCNVMTPNE